MFNRRSLTTRAFTLLELILVLVVIGILSALTVPSWRGVVHNAVDFSATSSAELIVIAAKRSASFDNAPLSDYYVDILGNQIEGYDENTDSVTVSNAEYSYTAYIDPDTGVVSSTRPA